MEQLNPASEPHSNGVVKEPTGNANDGIDILAILKRVARLWYLFVLFGALGYAGAWLYLRYTPELYRVTSSMLIETSEEDMAILNVVGGMAPQGPFLKLANEIQVLKSTPLMERVVEELNIDIEMMYEGRVLNKELYARESRPFYVAAYNPEPFAYNKVFRLQPIDSNRFNFIAGERSVGEYTFGQVFQNNFGSFLFIRDSINAPFNREVLLRFRNPEDVAIQYASKVGVWGRKETELINIGINEEIPQKGVDIITALIKAYDSSIIEEKNEVATKTLEFIYDRIDYIVEDLITVEKEAEDYIIEEDIIGGVQGEVGYQVGQLRSNDQQLLQLQMEMDYLNDVDNFLRKKPNQFGLVPYNMAFENVNVTGMIDQYNKMLLEKERIGFSATRLNPTMQMIDSQMVILKTAIFEAIDSSKSDIRQLADSLNQRNERIITEMRELPGKQRGLTEIERQQSVIERLYLYLLEKREETALSQAIAVSNVRIVEPPRSQGVVSPDPIQIYAIGLVAGLFLPLLFVVGIELLDDTVKSPDQIKSRTGIPFLGAIGFAKTKGNVVVESSSRSPIVEMFRLLRTNLQFLSAGDKNQVILITSSMSGEGKSFITINLGISLAMSGKRVLLAGMDLRKPKLEKYLRENGLTTGISNFLAEDVPVESLIQPSGQQKNLDFIASGPIPPNPAELLLNGRLEHLFKVLRRRYDYILIDTPPVGFITDALLINPYIDSTLYLVRYGKTKKAQLQIPDDIYREHKLKNMAIVFNGVKASSSAYHGHGYGYANGYHDYYAPEKKKKRWWRRRKEQT